MASNFSESFPVDRFDSTTDDFDQWVEQFEAAMEVSVKVKDDNRLKISLAWLKILLDRNGLAALKQCDTEGEDVTWESLKLELASQLVDPSEAYKWQTGKKKILWDGKESFATLVQRVKRPIDKYQKDLGEEARQRAYFTEFRNAFSSKQHKKYRDAIDIGCSATTRTIGNAKDLVSRVLVTQLSDDEAEAERGTPSFSCKFQTMEQRLEQNRANIATLTKVVERLNINADKMLADMERNSRSSSSESDK